MMIKFLIFDIDGTLVNSFNLGFNASNILLSRLGYAKTTEEEYHFGTRYRTSDRLARQIGLNPEKNLEEFNRKGIELAHFFDDLTLKSINKESVPIYDGISDLLHLLSKTSISDDGKEVIKLGALSNSIQQYVFNILDCYELTPLFIAGCIHGADSVAFPKPKPDGLIKCAKDLDLLTSECIYIGDSPSDGIAAKACGMLAVGVTYGSHSRESLLPHFDVVIDNVVGKQMRCSM